MAKTGSQGLPFQSHKTFTSSQHAMIQYAPEAMGKFSSREQWQEHMTFPKGAKVNSQDSGYSTAPEAMVKFGQTIPPSQALAISLFTQYARTFLEHFQEQMNFPKEEKGNSQDSGYNTAPEAMVKFGQTSPPSPALAISLFPQDAKTQDAPEAMVKLSSHEKLQEQMNLPKEARGISQDSGYNTALEAMVKFGQKSPPSQAQSTSPFTQDARNQDAPEAMPRSEGMTSMAEPLWTILQNKAAKLGDHEIYTMQDSDTIMQKVIWTKDTDCDTSAS
jgi:hypothetical protein